MARLALLVTLLLVLTIGSATALAPCTPVTTFSTSATLAWVPPVQPADVTTTGYTLAQQIDAGPWVSLPDIGPTQTTTTVTNLAPGHTYTWRLVAKGKRADGSTGVSDYATYQPDGSQPPCVTVTTPLPPPPPAPVSAPTNFRAVPQ
jgi:hypothetical protein